MVYLSDLQILIFIISLLGTSFEMDNTFIGVGFEYSHGERDDFPQIFNFPTGVVEPDDIVLFGTAVQARPFTITLIYFLV